MKVTKGLAFEIIVVVLLTVGRTVANDIAVMIWWIERPSRPFNYYQFTEILRGFYLAGLVLLIALIRGISFTEIGLSSPRWFKDLFIAICLVATTAISWMPFVVILKLACPDYIPRIHEPVTDPSTTFEYLSFLFATSVTGFAEELLTRGYLICRLRRLMTPLKAVLISAVVFSIWHVSQGLIDGVIHKFVWGLLYGYAFVTVGRLWPLALAHTINNVIVEFIDR